MNLLIIIFLILCIVLIIYFVLDQKEHFYISNSKINGQGLFVDQDIPKESILFEAINENKKVTHLGSKVNHCNNSNTALVEINNRWFLISTKDLKKNNELTANYNHTPYFIKKPDPLWTC